MARKPSKDAIIEHFTKQLFQMAILPITVTIHQNILIFYQNILIFNQNLILCLGPSIFQKPRKPFMH